MKWSIWLNILKPDWLRNKGKKYILMITGKKEEIITNPIDFKEKKEILTKNSMPSNSKTILYNWIIQLYKMDNFL